MKSILFISLILIGLNIANSVELKDENFTNFLRKSLENFRNQMKTGIPDFGIPALDPYVLPASEFKEETGPLKATLELKNTSITGLSKFKIQEIEASGSALSASFNITLGSIQIEGLYALDGLIYSIFPLSGNGSFWIDGSQIGVFSEAAFQITQNLTLVATNLSMKFQVGDVRANFENILGGGELSELVNSMINMFGKKILNTYLPDLLDEAILAFKDDLNEELKHLPME